MLATDLSRRSGTATEQEEDISMPFSPLQPSGGRKGPSCTWANFIKSWRTTEDQVKEIGTLPERKREAKVRAVCVCVSVYMSCVGATAWQLEGGVIDQEVEAWGKQSFLSGSERPRRLMSILSASLYTCHLTQQEWVGEEREKKSRGTERVGGVGEGRREKREEIEERNKTTLTNLFVSYQAGKHAMAKSNWWVTCCDNLSI